MLETLFPVFGVSERLLRLIVIVLAVGFVPALILSWAFEWTPQGIRPDAEIGSDSPQRTRNTRTLDRVIIVILTIAVLFFPTDKFVLDKLTGEQDWPMQAARAKAFSASIDADDMSVAVLPFISLSESGSRIREGTDLAQSSLAHVH